MNDNPMNLAELRQALPIPAEHYDTGGGCFVVEIDLPNGYSLIATDWATENGFDVGLYADWANNSEPVRMWFVASADVVAFITKYQKTLNGQNGQNGMAE
jgi:hypothetical protein